jgi:hypothetical protein
MEKGRGVPVLYPDAEQRPVQSTSPDAQAKVFPYSHLLTQNTYILTFCVFRVGHPAKALLFSGRDGAK